MKKSPPWRGSLFLMGLITMAIAAIWWFGIRNEPRTTASSSSPSPSLTRSSKAAWDISSSTSQLANRSRHDVDPGQAERTTSPASASPNSGKFSERLQSLPLPLEIKNGSLLHTENSARSSSGIEKRTSVYKTSFKYPFLRTEEQFKIDSAGAENLIKRRTMVADHLTVGLRPGFTEEQLSKWLDQQQMRIRKHIPNTSFFIVALPDANISTYDKALQLFSQTKNGPVSFAEPDYIQQINQTQPAGAVNPDDPRFPDQWNLKNAGQSGGTAGADINAQAAWDISTGHDSVVVAVIDTGIDINHPDLIDNLWVNQAEVPGDGIDNDGNGFVDDVHGYNFVIETGSPVDGNGHGTHTAGTIGAVGNNSAGISGVAQSVKIMALKFLADSGSGTDSDAITALAYATANGAMLTSNSWGGGDYSQAMEQIIQEAAIANVGCIIAAGNDGTNNDIIPVYPACYESPNIIVVSATDHNDDMAWFSCFGASSVHISAPGLNILSTLPNGDYGYNSGTSMAAPHVSGVAALMHAANPDMPFAAIKTAILTQARSVPALKNKSITGGVLDAGKTLHLAVAPYPDMVTSNIDDSGSGNTVGNDDSIISPGETVALSLTLRNLGGYSTGVLQGHIALATTDDQVSLLSDQATFGIITPGAESSNATQPFVISVDASHATPAEVALVLTLTDDQNRTWNHDLTLNIFTTAIVSGKVTRLDGTTPIASATVTLDGTIPATAVTNSEGEYQTSVVDGSYTVTASALNYITSSPETVQTPPDVTGVDFSLGFSDISITPLQLSATLTEDATQTTTLIVSNNGDQSLTLKVQEQASSHEIQSLTSPPTLSSSTSHIASSLPRSASTRTRSIEEGPLHPLRLPSKLHALDNNTATVSTLPFSDGFEDGTYNLWFESFNKTTREVVSDPVPPVGANSFHFKQDGTEDHLSGIHQIFDWGTQPGYVSFHIRTSARDKASGYVVLGDVAGNYLLDFIWFFANANGRFYINDDVGGNQTVAYETDRWYHIEFRNINWITKTFDYVVDGTIIQASVPFRNADTAQECAYAFIYNYQKDVDTWWDQFVFSNDALDWLTITPDSTSIAAGNQTTLTATFNATNLLAGTYRGTVQVLSNDPQQPEHSLPVEMVVTPLPNTAPVANSTRVSATEDVRKNITLTAFDAEADTLTYRITRLPLKGQLFQIIDGSPDAPITHAPTTVTSSSHQVMYVAPPNGNGDNYADFQFTVHDGRLQSAPGTITIDVAAVTDIPIARPDYYSIQQGQTIPVMPLLANDYSADLRAFNISHFTQPIDGKGTVANNGDNTLSFTPATSFVSGTSTFTYTISDTNRSATTTVTIRAGPLTASEWPMYGVNAQRTHSYPAGTLLSSQSLVPLWQHQLNHPPKQPVMGNGRAYFTTHDNTQDEEIIALNLTNGTTAWTQTEPSSEAINTPLLQGNYLHFTRSNAYSSSYITSLAAATGTLHSSYSFPGIPSEIGKHLLYANNRIHLVGGSGAKLYAVEPGTAYAPFITQLPYNETGTPTYADQIILLVTYGTIRAYDRDIGILRWTYQPDPAVKSESSIIAWQAGKAFTILGGKLHAIHTLQHPASAWSTSTTGHLFAPILSGHRVYAAHTSHEIRAYDIATGQLASTYQITTPITEQPIISQDTLLVPTTHDTKIIRLSDGQLIQSLPATGYITIADQPILITDPTSKQVSAFGYEPHITFTPDSGSYHTPVAVKITTASPDATIHYTTDGSLPTASSPTLPYDASVHFLRSSSLRAIAMQRGQPGPVRTAIYTITDTNNNNIPDWWETQYASQRPGTPTTLTPSDNYDHDGYTDLEEFILGTNPNQSDNLQPLVTTDSTGKVTLTWPSQPGRLYTLHSSTSLISNTWQIETAATNIHGTGTTIIWNDPSTPATSSPRKFYRLSVKLIGTPPTAP